ncbi:SusC/RagA family TonB-linked outer membrane protein [Chryseobacterium sp. H3056]|uniref:SusC/RagA family TonB-linked outer membrane protein n=1 Tax=Kaistella daneshvariae TaxID=2487074 RepID=A0A3N0WT81_9FLAO|nr:SusC/RagA family TonB-linked outer membrane protein [Kaistella daneshvariae]ROI08145.1 SusC/RagA family TonB-linked outer membrane protein [Kaistella daneshvariae]
MKKLTTSVLAVVLTASFALVNAQTRDTIKTQDIEGVVVTALGITRKPKELSYSVATVKNDDLTAANSTSTATALVGKVSGLQINVANNGVNPSTRVVLRGNRSLLNNNQALIVVDGFPSPQNVLNRINPEDIQEVTVLKGANASALYGSEAANGVLIITTKKGRGKLSVTLNSAVELETVAYLPQLQDQFGVGGFPDGTSYPLENVNWGPRYDGRLIEASETYANGDVWKIPYTPIKNNHRDFFDKAFSYRNGVTVSSGNADSNILFSVDFLKKNGTVPKDEFNRTTVRLNAGKKLGNFEFSGNASFFNSQTDVVAEEAGRQGRPLYWNILNTPLHIPLRQMQNWRDGYYTRNEVSYYRFYENPWFIIDTQRDKSEFNEGTFIGNVKYNFTEWLSASLRAGYTSNSNTFKRNRGAYTKAFTVPDAYSNMDDYGAYTLDRLSNFSRLNTDFIVSIDKDLGSDFNVKANVGQSVRIDKQNQIEVSGDNLIIPDFYDVSTRTGLLGGGTFKSNYRKVGIFADLTLGFQNWLFLNGTARNDYSSTLNAENRSYFYPGGGISVILSEAIPGIISDKGLNYLKLSGNITKSGNDPAAYANNAIFAAPAGFPYGSTTGLSQGAGAVSPDLRPEFTLAKEVGMEFAFFKSRLTGNVSLYQTNTTDQIISISTSTASGASSLLTNIGEIENKGIEVDLSAAVIKSQDFRWDVSVNYSGYDSVVKSLSEGVDELSIGGYADYSIVAEVGQPYPQLKATVYERDDQGRVIVGANGDPIQASGLKTVGKTTPDFVLGANTTLSYKRFKLYASADYRKGGVFYNNLVNALEFTGLTQHSVTANRLPFVFPNSVYLDSSGNYVPNTDRLTSGGGNAFWDKYSDVAENYVTDASFIKIREISLSYDFTDGVIANTGLTGLNVGVYARNPFMFRPAENVYTDPEFNYSTGNVIGIGDQRQTPPTRLFGLKLTAKF